MFDSPRSYTLRRPVRARRPHRARRHAHLRLQRGRRPAGRHRPLARRPARRPPAGERHPVGQRPAGVPLRDGMTIGAPTRSALEVEDAMLAFGMNGEPLPVEHGFPVRMVIPGLYGYVSACKWLTRHRGDDVRRLRRLLGRARLGRRRADQGRLTDRHPRAAALVPRRPAGHRRGRLGADPGHRPRRGAGRRGGLGSRPSSPRRSTPTCGASGCCPTTSPPAATRSPSAPPAPTARCRPRRGPRPFPAGASGWHSVQVVAG